jgi:GNAT superfamily N-acetyltransferase
VHLHIEPADEAAIPVIGRLAHSIWHEHYPSIISTAQIDYMLDRGYSAHALARFVTEPDAGLALAQEGNEPIGFAAWYRVDAKAMKLDKLYVLPQRQRRGVGRALIEHVNAVAARAGCAELTLNVNRGNSGAVRAYEACGFTIRSRGDFPIGGGFVMEDFIMVRTL